MHRKIGQFWNSNRIIARKKFTQIEKVKEKKNPLSGILISENGLKFHSYIEINKICIHLLISNSIVYDLMAISKCAVFCTQWISLSKFFPLIVPLNGWCLLEWKNSTTSLPCGVHPFADITHTQKITHSHSLHLSFSLT